MSPKGTIEAARATNERQQFVGFVLHERRVPPGFQVQADYRFRVRLPKIDSCLFLFSARAVSTIIAEIKVLV